jgi:hypothetical protein
MITGPFIFKGLFIAAPAGAEQVMNEASECRAMSSKALTKHSLQYSSACLLGISRKAMDQMEELSPLLEVIPESCSHTL